MATVQNLFAQTTENKGEKKRRDQKNEAKECSTSKHNYGKTNERRPILSATKM